MMRIFNNLREIFSDGESAKPVDEVEGQWLIKSHKRLALWVNPPLIVIGVGFVVDSLWSIELPEALEGILVLVIFAALIMPLALVSRMNGYKLVPKDKDEEIHWLQAKAGAYEFLLVYLLLFAVFHRYTPQVSALGIAMILIGVARLIEYRGMWSKKAALQSAQQGSRVATVK